MKTHHNAPVVLFIATLCAFFTIGGALTEAQFKQRIKQEVSVPFSSGLLNYNSALTALSQLLNGYNSEDDLPPEITPALTTSVNNFVTKIKLSSKNANALAKSTSDAVTQQINKVSQTEGKISENQKEITQSEVKVNGQQLQVNQAQSALNVAQQNLNAHREALGHAEKRYSDAKNKCLGRRRRKRGIWGKIKNAVKKVVNVPVKVVKETVKLPKKIVKETYRGICKTLNVFTKNIDKAKRDVRASEGQVSHASTQLAQKQAELVKTQQHLASLRKHHNNLQAQKKALQVQLNAFKASRDKIQLIDQKMKKTVTFIDQIKDPAVAAKFATDLGYLLDPSNLVQPLTEISHSLVRVNTDGLVSLGGVFNLTPAQIQELLAKLNDIKAKLSS